MVLELTKLNPQFIIHYRSRNNLEHLSIHFYPDLPQPRRNYSRISGGHLYRYNLRNRKKARMLQQGRAVSGASTTFAGQLSRHKSRRRNCNRGSTNRPLARTQRNDPSTEPTLFSIPSVCICHSRFLDLLHLVFFRETRYSFSFREVDCFCSYIFSPRSFFFFFLFLIESRRLGHSSVYDRLQSNSLVNSITWRDGCFNLMEQRLTIEILFYWSRCAFLAILHVYIYRLHVIMMDSYFIRVVLIVESF